MSVRKEESIGLLFRNDRNLCIRGAVMWELMRIKCDSVILQEYVYGVPSDSYLETPHEDFISHFSLLDFESPMEKEHGHVVELKWERYHDVYVYEDGFEDRYYIGD